MEEDRAVFTIFAEMERHQLDVERRKLVQEKQEHKQEGKEARKLQQEKAFEKIWKESP